MELIDKSALVAELERRLKVHMESNHGFSARYDELKDIRSFIDTLEVKDPYEQCIQHPSIKDGIQAHAETYSFNIESELLHQLTKEQQGVWRKEIEQAVISGGEMGVELARDPRYKENLEVKGVNFEKEWEEYFKYRGDMATVNIKHLAKYFFELGLKAQKGE